MAVRFLRLRGENVCSYREFDIPLANQGMVLLRGINGAGKSTPWHGLSHLLYKSTTKKLTARDLVNRHTNEGYLLRLDLEVDGVPYAFEETRDHPTLGTGIQIYREGQKVSPRGVKDARELIRGLIRWDPTQFFSTVYLSQEHNHVLVDGTPAVKRNYVRELFGLVEYQELELRARKQVEVITQALATRTGLRERYAELKAEAEGKPDADDLRRKLQRRRQQRDELREQVTKLEARLDRLTADLPRAKIRDELRADLDKLSVPRESAGSSSLAAAKVVLESLSQDLTAASAALKLAERAEGLRKLLAEISVDADTEVKITDLRKQLDEVRGRRLHLTKVELPAATQAESIRTRLAAIPETETISELEPREHELEREVDKMEDEIKHKTQHMRKGICPTCKRPWELTAGQIQQLETEIVESRARTTVLTRKLHTCRRDLDHARRRTTARQQLKSLTARSQEDVQVDLDRALRRERRLQGQLKTAEEREALTAQLHHAPEETPDTLRRQIKGLRDQEVAARVVHDDLVKARDLWRRLDALGELKYDTETLRQQKKDTAEKVVAVREQLERLAAEIVTLRHQLTSAEERERELLELRVTVRELRQQLLDQQILVTLREGFQYLLQRREREILERVTAQLPSYLTPLLGDQARWVKVALARDTDGIDLRVSAVGNDLPTNGPSPGMKAKLGLGLVFALRSLYSTRLASNLLVLDEPIYRIDSRSRPGFVNILNDLRGQVETCVVITHEQEVAGAMFDKRWQATIMDGISHLAT